MNEIRGTQRVDLCKALRYRRKDACAFKRKILAKDDNCTLSRDYRTALLLSLRRHAWVCVVTIRDSPDIRARKQRAAYYTLCLRTLLSKANSLPVVYRISNAACYYPTACTRTRTSSGEACWMRAMSLASLISMALFLRIKPTVKRIELWISQTLCASIHPHRATRRKHLR